ncbi:hypothetical protein NX801_14585 [Streptomyces sp. LP05-1]|uniref:Uncharacterized protein n=1 Tax=Streptomyces pyxinae TaxID=2970734 RepID=A0ABT2CHH5_9ACTN|nr:hypothetical protein [Streptomyces sp. LP05-1]MCS0636863.1 hypothetical protein [Streptomyces sp. LP05-1]
MANAAPAVTIRLLLIPTGLLVPPVLCDSDEADCGMTLSFAGRARGA